MEIIEIEVEIDTKGQVKLSVHGAEGRTCLDITDDLEKILGANIISRKFTTDTLSIEEQQNPHRQSKDHHHRSI